MMYGSSQRTRAHPQVRSRGFTLIELMVVLVLLSVVLAVGIPGLSSLNAVTRLKAYTNEIVAGVQLSRSEAIKRNRTVRMCVSTDGSTCAGSGNWGDGWIVLADPLNPADPDVVVNVMDAKPDSYALFSLTSVYEMRFTPSGVGLQTVSPGGTSVAPSTIRICRSDPVGHQEREVDVAASGRPSVRRTTDGTCP